MEKICPRTWSSHSNICANDVFAMNGVEDISGYRDIKSIYCSPTLQRKTAATTYDFPEHPPKKEKKWSLGSLFRRKKKECSESSTEEDADKRGFLNRRKKKGEKRKKSNKQRATFDHVVIPPGPSTMLYNGHARHDDSGILSDPTGGFASYVGRTKLSPCSKDQLRSNQSSSDSLLKKVRKGRAKTRAEARRDNVGCGSSSDEDSVSSSRFRSDDNLGKPRDNSLSRRSRAARTERYIRRMSRDEECCVNRDCNLRTCKSDAEYGHHRLIIPTKSPTLPNNLQPKITTVDTALPQSGLSTIPPSHTNHKNKYNISVGKFCKLPATNCFGSDRYHSLNSNDPKDTTLNYQRSVSYDANIHSSHSPEITPSEIMHVQLPLGKPNRFRNLSLVEQPNYRGARQPPPPPPRDPWRLVTAQNNRPLSYCFEKNAQSHPGTEFTVTSQQNHPTNSFKWHPNFRTTSEDHLPLETSKILLQPRPASVTTDNPNQKVYRRGSHGIESSDHYQYLADRNPRSRKPIFIQPTTAQTESKKAIDFWKRKDQNEAVNSLEVASKKPAPQMFTAQSHIRTKIFLPSVLKADMEVASEDAGRVNCSPSLFKPISPTNNVETKRKSSNLEEALDELEAIYNSLRLGDEDLLDRAEQRELSVTTKKFLDAKAESYPAYGGIPRGAISDSGFNYEPFDTIDSPKRKRILKKNRPVDRKCDDMAYRKLNKERTTISDPKDVLSSVSYLLTSPIHGTPSDEVDNKQHNEPDITLDDVVYRTIKHANNTLKVTDPQPPFGIPVGPVLPAANSDYLHAVPEQSYPNFGAKKLPDVVKDDLAFRNLRKDLNKDPVLPPLTPDDVVNNNSELDKFNSLKKKRAVRSLSANIYNLMNNEITIYPVCEERSKTISNDEINKSNLTDIADAMQIAREILKEKENKIRVTRRDFLSDTEAKYGKKSNNILNEQRKNFLNGMKSNDDFSQLIVNGGEITDVFLQSKPPKCATPEKKLSYESKSECVKSSLEDLLTAFAIEAHETSERITNELKKMEDDIEALKLPGSAASNSTCDDESANKEMVATTKTESTPIEEVEQILQEADHRESVANIVLTRKANEGVESVPIEMLSDSEHDYVNMGSDAELEEAIPLIDEFSDDVGCVTPFEEKKASLVAGFQELNHIKDENNSINTLPTEIDSNTDDRNDLGVV